jgi:hypothetical protein
MEEGKKLTTTQQEMHTLCSKKRGDVHHPQIAHPTCSLTSERRMRSRMPLTSATSLKKASMPRSPPPGVGAGSDPASRSTSDACRWRQASERSEHLRKNIFEGTFSQRGMGTWSESGPCGVRGLLFWMFYSKSLTWKRPMPPLEPPGASFC